MLGDGAIGNVVVIGRIVRRTLLRSATFANELTASATRSQSSAVSATGDGEPASNADGAAAVVGATFVDCGARIGLLAVLAVAVVVA